MRKLLIFLFIVLNYQNSFAEPNNLEKEDFFYIGTMKSHNNDFTLYFKTRGKAVLGRGEEFNYITDYPQDLYIYNNHTKSEESLISYDWFPSRAKQIIENYDFPVFP